MDREPSRRKSCLAGRGRGSLLLSRRKFCNTVPPLRFISTSRPCRWGRVFASRCLHLHRIAPHLSYLGRVHRSCVQKLNFAYGDSIVMSRIMLRPAQRIAVVSMLALFATVPALAQTATWTIDPNHSTAQFTVRHLGISNVRGNFTKVAGTVVLNEKDISQSQVSASIDVSSVDTRVEMRDKDLRSPNFFDVEKYPTIEFKSKKVVSDGGKLQLIGDLTIHGTTREAESPPPLRLTARISVCSTTNCSGPAKRWWETTSRFRSMRNS